MKNKNFIHLDGAIHLYTQEEYLKRKNENIDFNRKFNGHIKAQSVKLFLINGEIPTNQWAEIVSLFSNGNPLMFEYLSGEPPEEIKDIMKNI